MGQPEIANPFTTEPPFARSPTPKLGIVHLLLWTLCTAIYLTLSRTFRALRHDLPDEFVSILRVMDVLQGAVIGAVLAGAIVLAYSRVRHQSSVRRHPGHWLLLIEAAGTTIYLALELLFLLVGQFGRAAYQQLMLYGLIKLLSGVADVFAGYRSETLRWKLAFGVMAVLDVSQGLSFFTAMFLPIHQSRLLLSAWIVVVSILDLRVHQRRDWLHWTGVATYVASSGQIVILMIWIRFFQP